jgi:hypothetical protein
MKFSEEWNFIYFFKQSITLTPTIFRKQTIVQQRYVKAIRILFYPTGPDVRRHR